MRIKRSYLRYNCSPIKLIIVFSIQAVLSVRSYKNDERSAKWIVVCLNARA